MNWPLAPEHVTRPHMGPWKRDLQEEPGRAWSAHPLCSALSSRETHHITKGDGSGVTQLSLRKNGPTNMLSPLNQDYMQSYKGFHVSINCEIMYNESILYAISAPLSTPFPRPQTAERPKHRWLSRLSHEQAGAWDLGCSVFLPRKSTTSHQRQ